MMDEDLPKEFDLVVVGTGFVESAVAAAASRIGKTVLHVDPNEFYGSCWASFNLENYQSFLSNNNVINHISFAKQTWNIPAEDNETTSNENGWTQASVLKDSRKFNIDLCPKLLFSAGKLVELLVSSNICRYAEFRAIDRVCTLFQEQLLSVPCSRTDVFNTKDLTIVEKRLLMKLLTSCMNYEEKSEEFVKYQDKTFKEYLEANKLTEKIIHCVMNSIAMCDSKTSLDVGVEKMKTYLQSLGRYGNSPFLFPMYGCGEIPQCFCRLCAVFGGTYCLKRKINIVRAEDEKVSLDIDGHIIDAGFIVTSISGLGDVAPASSLCSAQRPCGNLARCVLITSSPIGSEELNSGGGGVNMIRLTTGEPDCSRSAILLQLSHYSGTCPKGLYLIHITTEAITTDPEADLAPFFQQVLGPNVKDSPKLLYASYFLITPCKSVQTENQNTSQTSRILSTCVPFFELDYDTSIQNAKNIFSRMYHDESFLPRAPDPEEIIMGDEDPMALAEHNLPDDLKQQMEEVEEGMELMDVCEGEAENADIGDN